MQRAKTHHAALEDFLRNASSIHAIDVPAAVESLGAKLPPLPTRQHG